MIAQPPVEAAFGVFAIRRRIAGGVALGKFQWIESGRLGHALFHLKIA
jgi:hypothetical protein